MKKTCGVPLASYLRDQVRLPADTEVLGEQYRTAAPFPYLTIDNVFPDDLLQSVFDEASNSQKKDWIYHDTEKLNKIGTKSALGIGDAAFELLSYLHSANFLYLLSEITGIWNLVPDPYLHGAGHSIIPPGGVFDVHADRNFDPLTGLRRRIALIIYLNKGWKHELGGQLELWNEDATQCEVTVEPEFNRTILLEIEDKNYHGIPKVKESGGRSRHSFMVYYNTIGAAADKDHGVHGSIYAPRCYDHESRARKVARNVMPPILFNFLRRRIA